MFTLNVDLFFSIPLPGFISELLTSQKNFTLRFRQTPPVSERKRQTTDRSDRVANSDYRRRTSNGIDLPL